MQFDKALRDKIPGIIKKSGYDCNVNILSNEEFLSKLEEKLVEEIQEYRENKSVEEIVDILEVIYRISDLKGIHLNQLE